MIEHHIVFLGFGNMAKAIIKGLLKSGVIDLRNVSVIKTTHDVEFKNVKTYTNPASVPIFENSIIILCVKPQIFIKEKDTFKKYAGNGNLILSVMAGISAEFISSVFGEKQSLVRCMPNTPSLLGKGFSAYWLKENCERKWISSIDKILEGIGKKMRVENEDKINKATSFSGSGPGYFFYFAEKMINAAIKNGFSENEAKLMITQTMTGAALLLEKENGNAEDLKAGITSKGGTTEAALNHFYSLNTGEIIEEAINKAYLKSIEISAKLS